MLVNEKLTQPDFKPLAASDTVNDVQEKMDELSVSTLPVVDPTTKKLVGQITQIQVSDRDPQARVSDFELQEAIKVYEGQHIFEAARLMLQYELRLLPLVDEEWTFLGMIAKQKVLEYISRMLNLAEDGTVVTIELDPIDFSISEVVQIIETEGAKILGITVESPDEQQQTFEVSFKLNLDDVSRITAALKRYDYNVLVESESTIFGRDLEHRADELIKYMDM